MDDANFRAALAEQGYDGPELLERSANLHNPEHSHEFSVSALILAGQLSVTTAAGTTTCGAGDTYSLAGGIPHSELYGPEGARILVGRHY